MRHPFRAQYWDVMMMPIQISLLVVFKKIAQVIKFLGAKDFVAVVICLI